MRRLHQRIAVEPVRVGWLGRLPAAAKVLPALGLIGLVAAAPPEWTAVPWAAAVVIGGVALVARLPPRIFPGRLCLLLPVILGLALLSLFHDKNWPQFLSVLTRSSLCVSTMILLANTTRFSEILGFLRAVRVPSLLLTTLALLYRYLFALVEEIDRVRVARASRTFSTSSRTTWKILGGVIGELFVRSTMRAERIYAAMLSRGWR